MDNLGKMDEFLETYKLPKLNQEESEKLNKPITTNVIKAEIKKHPTNQSPGPGGFTNKFYQTFKEELTPRLFKLFQNFKRKENSQAHFMRTELS